MDIFQISFLAGRKFLAEREYHPSGYNADKYLSEQLPQLQALEKVTPRLGFLIGGALDPEEYPIDIEKYVGEKELHEAINPIAFPYRQVWSIFHQTETVNGVFVPWAYLEHREAGRDHVNLGAIWHQTPGTAERTLYGKTLEELIQVVKAAELTKKQVL